MDQDSIEEVAKETLSWPDNKKWDTTDKDDRFRSCFGAPSRVVAELWNRIEPTVDEPGAHPKHLLWALVFLKVYSTEEVHCAIVGWPSTRTFRKWSWYFVRKISELKDDVIRLENRFVNGPPQNDGPERNCYLTVDCTDCPVFEPFPFDREMYSHKHNGPGLKYEVAVCIRTGHIVWINGPFVASVSDPVIFEIGLSNQIGANEVVEADGVYRGPEKAMMPTMGINSAARKQKSVARGRHEVVNGRLKQFSVLTTFFRHSKPNKDSMIEKHELCFTAIAVITQLKFENGGQTFNVVYDVTY